MAKKFMFVCFGILALAYAFHLDSRCGYAGDIEGARPRQRLMCEGNTPDDLLRLLGEAYRQKSIDLYSKVLHESYRFQFCERDFEAAGVEPDTPWWLKAGDVGFTEDMFNSPQTTLSASFPMITSWQVCTDGLTGLDGLCCSVRPEVVLTVQVGGDVPLVFVVEHSAADIMAVESPRASGCWAILLVRETLVEPCDTGCATWGSVKSMYR